MTSMINAWENTKNFLRSTWKSWRGQIIFFGVLLLLARLAWPYILPVENLPSYAVDWEKIAILVLICFALFGFGLVTTFFSFFRGIGADEEKLNWIITYCYAFIIFSLSISTLPFIALPLVPGLDRVMIQSQIGIVDGCSSSPVPAGIKDDVIEQTVPRELRCGYSTDQWVVNIGGTATPTVAPAETTKTIPKVQISGGLVVPLYAIVLSLMGAVVSMTRRVPEIQRRLSPADPEYINYDQAREMLVFQIMQVVSAPLIVLTAYYLIDPSSRGTTIALSFASGFSSETVLLLIRAMLEKVSPESRTTNPSSTPIRLMPGRLDFGEVTVPQTVKKTIVITNSGSTNLEITNLTCTGEFTVTTSTPLVIVPAASGNVDVEFKPTDSGTKPGVLAIVASVEGFPRAIELTGIGVAA